MIRHELPASTYATIDEIVRLGNRAVARHKMKVGGDGHPKRILNQWAPVLRDLYR